MTTIAQIPTLCPCGNAADPESVELAAMFPKLAGTPLCLGCRERQEAEERRAKADQQQAAERAQRAARLSAIPPEMLRTTIDHAQFNAGLWCRVESWTPADARWLGIVGPAGGCKTRCLALLAKRLILSGHRILWTSAVDFQDYIDDLRSDRDSMREAQKYLRACKHTAVLVLDDFGKNTWNNSVERHLFSVIDYRKTHDLPVLWSANTTPLQILSSGQLSADRGAPLIGRLLEASRILTAT